MFYWSRYSYEDITLKPSILYITLLLISSKAVCITLQSEDHDYQFLYPQGHILVSVAREHRSQEIDPGGPPPPPQLWRICFFPAVPQSHQ
jgi:hypothetical protein